MKNNQGVTLIELIIVMLIMSVLAGAAIFGIRSLDSGNVRSTVKRIDTLIDYVRVENMSKFDTYYLEIEKKGGPFTAKVLKKDQSGNMSEVLSEELKLTGGTITYVCSNGTSETEYAINEVPPVILTISNYKSCGGFQPVMGGEIRRIVISAAGHTYTIGLVSETGKHYIK